MVGSTSSIGMKLSTRLYTERDQNETADDSANGVHLSRCHTTHARSTIGLSYKTKSHIVPPSLRGAPEEKVIGEIEEEAEGMNQREIYDKTTTQVRGQVAIATNPNISTVSRECIRVMETTNRLPYQKINLDTFWNVNIGYGLRKQAVISPTRRYFSASRKIL